LLSSWRRWLKNDVIDVLFITPWIDLAWYPTESLLDGDLPGSPFLFCGGFGFPPCFVGFRRCFAFQADLGGWADLRVGEAV
jgi:hypothetical protein